MPWGERMTEINDANDSADQLVTYETRYKGTKHADHILPFVLEALATVGLGSACVVRKGGTAKGIQLTAPVNLALLIISTIDELDQLDPPKFQGKEFYPPLLHVAGNDGAISDVIRDLRLIPPDMCLAWIRVGDDKHAIAVSGPAVAERRNAFRDEVLPSLTTLVRNMETPGFPTA